jgi:glucoamylase
LTGERAHYALLAGDTDIAESLCRTMENCASRGGLFPEQVWDADDVPERELFRGRPSGSAMPLVWAHAEYVKLVRSLRDGAVFDLPPQTRQRYIIEKRQPRLRDWREAWRRSKMPAGQVLRVELCAPAIVRFSFDGWLNWQELPTTDLGVGVHAVELPSQDLKEGAEITFTWHWLTPQNDENVAEAWRGKNFSVRVTT